MRQDVSTLYQRASNGAIIGLIAQGAVLGLVGVMYALSGMPLLFFVAVHSVAGLVIWALTWLVYRHQFQSELEKYEAEKLAAAGETESIFVNPEDGLTPAARRLKNIVKFGMPIASFLVAAYLIAANVTFVSGLARVAFADLVKFNASSGTVGFTLTLMGLAFLAFVASRYLTSMSRAPRWTLLRAGAGFLTSGVLFMALGSVGLALFNFSPQLLAVVTWLTPVLSLVIGVEILLNQVLDFYRPRGEEEVPRPAFDSRLLNLLASPGSIVKSLNEAINYQFGFEITRSWFWQLLARAFGYLVALGVLMLLLLSCVVVVEPQQKGLLTTFGRLDPTPLEPGLHLKWPWPVAQVDRYDVARVRQFTVGSHETVDPDKAVLWGEAHSSTENLLMAQPPRDSLDVMTTRPSVASLVGVGPGTLPATRGGPASTQPSDQNPPVKMMLIGIEVFVRYRIKDVTAYARSTAESASLIPSAQSSLGAGQQARGTRPPPLPPAEARLKLLADAEASRAVLQHDIDELMGPARERIAAGIKVALQTKADANGLGLEVTWIGIAGVHPAQQVADAFLEVIKADSERRKEIEQSLTDEVRLLAEAVGSLKAGKEIAAKIEQLQRLSAVNGDPVERLKLEQEIQQMIQGSAGIAAAKLADARAQRWQKEFSERARAEQFLGQLAAYNASPYVYSMRRVLDTLAEGYAGQRKVVVIGDLDVVFRMKANEELGRLGELRLDARVPGTGGTAVPGAGGP